MQYKLTIMPALEASQGFLEQFYNTKEEAIAAKDAVANTLLFLQDDIMVMEDFSNSIHISQLDFDGDWVEVEEWKLTHR